MRAPAPRDAGVARQPGTQVGNQAHLRLAAISPRLQRDGPDPPLQEAKKEEATDAFKGGLKAMGKAAFDDPAIKAYGLDFASRLAKPIWDGAQDGDKVAMVAGGLAIGGAGLAALASNRTGRGVLSGVPLGAPLSLIPYAILSGFSYDLPKLKTDPLALHFSVKGDDLIDLAHRKLGDFPLKSLSVDFTVSVAPDGKVTTPFVLAKIGVAKGLTLAGGYGVATDLPTLVSPGDGAPLAPYKAFPQPDKGAPPAGVAGFVSLDLAQAIPSLGVILGNGPERP